MQTAKNLKRGTRVLINQDSVYAGVSGTLERSQTRNIADLGQRMEIETVIINSDTGGQFWVSPCFVDVED
ncbi:hypothetical protein LHJ74_30880 [Streptomyces sp. N2-109]|uniref:Uncharacterized protein n=1 Tax=Streptomyces gossypii TaxID=2883101 RepID=A0ABT2K268_9ACTN|nr:hypothetical protein [Streptomyces gossypii]MCT2594262.1 hypothetical protein [Streptomyces gossypii]